MDDEVAVQLRKEKEARKAEVLKKLEIPKSRFLSALEKQDASDPRNRKNLETTKLHKTVTEVLKKNAYFSMSHYLHCAKAICIAFGTKHNRHCLEDFEISFTYILTHAKLFGDQTIGMFPLDCKDKIVYSCIKPSLSGLLPDTEYMRKILVLIEDLKKLYDETKYRILNANVTYLTLLILRNGIQEDDILFSSSFQQNIQDDYRKLCPHSLSCELPRMMNKQLWGHFRNFGKAVYLALHAFLTVKDDLSRMILQKTCMQYLEWYNMELPGLFFKVVSLYGVSEARLWDLLSSEKTSESLIRLANFFNTVNSDTAEIVPYCMVFNGESASINARLLSGSYNAYLCTILAHIVDKNIGFDKSFIRNSDWAVDSAAKKAGMKIAKVFHQFYTK